MRALGTNKGVLFITVIIIVLYMSQYVFPDLPGNGEPQVEAALDLEESLKQDILQHFNSQDKISSIIDSVENYPRPDKQEALETTEHANGTLLQYTFKDTSSLEEGYLTDGSFVSNYKKSDLTIKYSLHPNGKPKDYIYYDPQNNISEIISFYDSGELALRVSFFKEKFHIVQFNKNNDISKFEETSKGIFLKF